MDRKNLSGQRILEYFLTSVERNRNHKRYLVPVTGYIEYDLRTRRSSAMIDFLLTKTYLKTPEKSVLY